MAGAMAEPRSEDESWKPALEHREDSRMRVALTYNRKQHIEVTSDAPDDALAEYDSKETVQAI